MKYASAAVTTRPVEGIQMLYDPGLRLLLPRFTPTQARGSSEVFEYCSRGLTAKARHPNGMMGKTLGTRPVRISNEDRSPSSPVGPVVRLRTSIAINTAKFQKETGTPLEARKLRTRENTERIARSATPFS